MSDILAESNTHDDVQFHGYEVTEIIIQHVINSTQGMARWTKVGSNVNDEKDLDDYMFEVAGRVVNRDTGRGGQSGIAAPQQARDRLRLSG